MMKTKDLTFVQALLKRFGTIIYTGNQLDDITLMDLELQDLYDWKLISDEDFFKAKAILKKEYDRLNHQ